MNDDFLMWTYTANIILFPKRAPFHFQHLIAQTSTECYSFINKDSEIFSKDKKWLLRREYRGKIALFKREIKDLNSLRNRSDLSDTQDVKKCVFTDDNNALVYSTTSANLYTISLTTGIKLRSISGLYPVYCSSGDGKEAGFILSSTNESKIVLLRDLPANFLFNSFRSIMATEAVSVAFNSCDIFSVLFSNGSVESWKIVDSPLVLSDTRMPPSQLMECKQIEFPPVFRFQASKCFFLIAGI